MSKSLTFRFLLLTCVLSLSIWLNTSPTTIVQANGPFMIYLPTIMNPEKTPIVPVYPPDEGTYDSVLYVATGNRQANGCGSNTAPCGTIQQAVDQAMSSQNSKIIIKVAKGTYTISDGKAVVSIVGSEANSKAIRIIGGYTTSDWTRTTLDPDDTIIDAQNGRRGIFIRNLFNTVTVEGMTIQNGLMNDWLLYDNLDFFFGGGLSCVNSSTVLSDMTFKNNRVQRDVGNQTVGGGGVGLYWNCPGTLQNVVFDGNQAIAGNAPDNTRGGIAQGGGLLASEGSPIVATNLTFLNNRAVAGSGGVGQDNERFWLPDALGGAASLQLNEVVIDGVTASGNEAIGGQGSSFAGVGSGGALFFELNIGTVVVKNGVLRNNKVTGGESAAIAGSGTGGAIMATDSTLSLENLELLDNQAIGGSGGDAGDAGGGALYFTTAGVQPSNIVGTNLIIAGNTAEAGLGNNRYGGGGGVFSQNTTLTLNHVTIDNNHILNSMQGVAIVSLHNTQGTTYNTILKNSIISNNQQHDIFDNPMGPVIALVQGDNLTLQSVLFYNNTLHYSSGDCAECGQYYGWMWWDPAGAPTFTVSNLMEGDPAYINAANLDYHLTANSAAIDKATGSSTTTDIDGGSRPFGSAPDLGADEYGASLR